MAGMRGWKVGRGSFIIPCNAVILRALICTWDVMNPGSIWRVGEDVDILLVGHNGIHHLHLLTAAGWGCCDLHAAAYMGVRGTTAVNI